MCDFECTWCTAQHLAPLKHILGMTFIRTKRNPKTGKIYRYRQRSVRVGHKIKSVHLGKAGDGHVPAMLEDAYMFGEKEKAPAKEASEQLNAVAPDSVHQAGQDGETGRGDVGQE
jgi:hypothetical protein